MAAKAFTASVSQPDEFRGPAYPPQGQWTYEDYLRLPDDGRRYEILRGVLYVSAAPVTLHQIILRRFVRVLLFFLEENPVGEFLFAPVDVIFPAGLATPVQPDLLFITAERAGIIKDRNIEGAPDLVLEVLSPSTRRLDRKTKFDVYAEAGVHEYWLADPLAQTVEVFVLREAAYVLLEIQPRGKASVRGDSGFRAVPGRDLQGLTELSDAANPSDYAAKRYFSSFAQSLRAAKRERLNAQIEGNAACARQHAARPRLRGDEGCQFAAPRSNYAALPPLFAAPATLRAAKSPRASSACLRFAARGGQNAANDRGVRLPL